MAQVTRVAGCGHEYLAAKALGAPRMTCPDCPAKGCSVEGCVGAYRAKGLCGTHYNQQQPNRHRKAEIACAYCGQPALKFQNGARNKMYCSWECQQQNRWPEFVAREARRLAGVIAIYQRPPVVRSPELPPRKFFAGTCQICASPYVGLVHKLETTSRTCSPKCATRKRRVDRSEGEHRRRALKRDAFVAPVFRRKIYERDRWRCQICKRKVKVNAIVPHPRAATLDHIVPLAKGGTHEPANVRLACFLCNAQRGDRGVEEQLALIG